MPGRRSEIAGVAMHPWQVQLPDARERIFAGIAATGIQWVRIDMPWSWVEEHGPTVRNGQGQLGPDRRDLQRRRPARR